jgi:hypothetical protein
MFPFMRYLIPFYILITYLLFERKAYLDFGGRFYIITFNLMKIYCEFFLKLN